MLSNSPLSMSAIDESAGSADVDARGGEVTDKLRNLSRRYWWITSGSVSSSCCPCTEVTRETRGAVGVVGATSVSTLEGGFRSWCGCSRRCIQRPRPITC